MKKRSSGGWGGGWGGVGGEWGGCYLPIESKFKVYDVTTWETIVYNTHTAQYLNK